MNETANNENKGTTMSTTVKLTINGYQMSYTRNDKGEWTNDVMGERCLEADVKDVLKKFDRKQFAVIFPVNHVMGY